MTPALVLGSADAATTLEVIRILGRRGIPQFTVGAGRGFVSRSRWYRPLPSGHGPEPDPSALPELLHRVPFSRMVLIPCTDAWVMAIARLEPAVAERFPASLAPRETIEVLLDKGRFAEAAQHLGLPHPRTICLGSDEDLAAVPEDALLGAFLKPRDSYAFQQRYGVKGFHFKTRSQAVALAGEALRAGFQVLLQEYIPGPPSHYYFLNGFVDRTGRFCGWNASRRMLMFPVDFGDGCYGVGVPLTDVAPVVDAIKQFLSALCYRGVFDAELKYDAQERSFKVIEINVRPYLYVGFPARWGVDLVTMSYRDALGLPVDSAEYEAGHAYVNASYVNAHGMWRLFRTGRLNAWTWCRAQFGAYQPAFSWDDPVPGISGPLGRLWRFMRRTGRAHLA